MFKISRVQKTKLYAVFLILCFFLSGCMDTTQNTTSTTQNRSFQINPVLNVGPSNFASWKVLQNPRNLQLDAITCNSNNTCYALSRQGYVEETNDFGRSWQSFPAPLPLNKKQEIKFISCPGYKVCYTFGTEAAHSGPNFYLSASTVDGGISWNLVKTQYSEIPWVRDFYCSSLTTCYAILLRGILVTTDSAKTWQEYPTPTAVNAIACSSEKVCVVVGGTWGNHGSEGLIWVTTNGGKEWSDKTFDNQFPVMEVSCPTALNCWASGGVWGGSILTTMDGGTTWTKAVMLNANVKVGIISPLICSTADTCYGLDVVGRNVIATKDKGQNWYLQSINNKQLRFLACTPTNDCVGIGDDGLIMNNKS